MKYFKKYKFLKFAIAIAIIEMSLRKELAIGGGIVLLIWAIFAVFVLEKTAKMNK